MLRIPAGFRKTIEILVHIFFGSLIQILSQLVLYNDGLLFSVL